MKKKLLTVSFVLLLTSCCNDVLVRSSKSMQDTVLVEYLKYVENDESLLPAQKTIRINRVKSYGVLLNESSK